MSEAFTSSLAMCGRTFLIYVISLVMLRLNKKIMGISTPFNFIVSITLGSLAAEAIIEVEHFWPIASSFVFLIFLNVLLNIIGFYVPFIEWLTEGSPTVLMEAGEIQWKNMEKHYITENELTGELQKQLHTKDLSAIEAAIFASDGAIHFIKKKRHQKGSQE